MPRHLVLTIRLHDDRYHGVAEWPPSPARVFQALVAGVIRANNLADDDRALLKQIESLPPPIIAAPPARPGQRVALFVPNNDADTLGDDLGRIAEIRAKKLVAPRLIEGEAKFVYVWPLDDAEGVNFEVVDRIAAALYQLGRGIDMAWATTEFLDEEALEERLLAHPGSVHRPGAGAVPLALACPVPGSLASLVRRFDETSRRLRPNPAGGATAQLFVQPSKPSFVQVPYDSAPHRWVFELHRSQDADDLVSWPLRRAAELVTRLRDGAAERLKSGLPAQADVVERVLIGRKADGADTAPSEWRIRLAPLPSIGHEHADLAIRRVVVEVPAGGPLAPLDIRWAFSGLQVDAFVLTPALDDKMLARYTASARCWRTITAAALPEPARRRRIEPARQREEAKDAAERMREEERAAQAVAVALRHAKVGARPLRLRVQREPFDARGDRAEVFADNTRFRKERLWHVEIEFERPVTGPLLLGDGRFLGLGLLAPGHASRDEFVHEPAKASTAGLRAAPAAFAFEITAGLSEGADPLELARALRRAVMARVQMTLDDAPLPPFFSGHAIDGKPAQNPEDAHLAFFFVGPSHLVIMAPHLLDRREPTAQELRHLTRLAGAVDGFVELRAGRAGRLALAARSRTSVDAVYATSLRWISRTPYQVHRHAHAKSASEALTADVQADCLRRGLPRPEVTVERARGVDRRGLEGDLRLEFPVAVRGPLVLGRSRHAGGGLFVVDA
ncbi:CRISPR-associated protein Csb2 [Nannocystis exedens]|uniref:CRISPR-associated protein Csb2 n=1 Tax=Nannocystis exedens TaxID=54 RepID=A0A1I2IDA1_9BACT|nr:type I-U CRISPR-associated protein Csb2 [Nannocystis exedens]PCC68198.1 type I-U CRISPR-associated protein Cas5/Cas6 [Nannocystis exedens]SFF39633.1 CRISPR-associated protein Csb2 [Nannocystis exedens]